MSTTSKLTSPKAFQISPDARQRIAERNEAQDAEIAARATEPQPGYCGCGCGSETGFWDRTDRSQGIIKGEPKRFVRGHQRRGFKLPDADSPQYVANRSVPTPGPLSGPCHIWIKATTESGYGVAYLEGKTQLVHRWLWEALSGSVPDGHELHHMCEVPSCVNPEHLLPVTRVQHKALHAALKAKAV